MASPPYSIKLFSPSGNDITPSREIAIAGINYIRIRPGGYCASAEIQVYPPDIPELKTRPYVQIFYNQRAIFYGVVSVAPNPKVVDRTVTCQIAGAHKRLHETPHNFVPLAENSDIGQYLRANFQAGSPNIPAGLTAPTLAASLDYGFKIGQRRPSASESVGDFLDDLAKYLAGFIVPASGTTEYNALKLLYPDIPLDNFNQGHLFLAAKWGVLPDGSVWFRRGDNAPLVLTEGDDVIIDYSDKQNLEGLVTRINWYWGEGDYYGHATSGASFKQLTNETRANSPFLFEDYPYDVKAAPRPIVSYSKSEKVDEYGEIFKAISVGDPRRFGEYRPFSPQPIDPNNPTATREYEIGSHTDGDFSGAGYTPPSGQITTQSGITAPANAGGVVSTTKIIGTNGNPNDIRYPIDGFYQVAIELYRTSKALLVERRGVPITYMIKPISIVDTREPTYRHIDLSQQDTWKDYKSDVPDVIPLNLLTFLDANGNLPKTYAYISFDLRGKPSYEHVIGRLGVLSHSALLDRVAMSQYKLPPQDVAEVHYNGIDIGGYQPVVELYDASGAKSVLRAEMYEHYFSNDEKYAQTVIKIGQPDDGEDLAIRDLIEALSKGDARNV